MIKEVKDIDEDIFKKILKEGNEDLFHGFTHEDYLEFYNIFYDDICDIDNTNFINKLHVHNESHYENMDFDDILNIFNRQQKCNKEFIKFLLEKYEDKISTFTPRELLKFIQNVTDAEILNEIFDNDYEKLNEIFDDISEDELNSYLDKMQSNTQMMLISTFFKNIIKKHDITKIIYRLDYNAILKLYDEHKELFKKLTLNDWIKVCLEKNIFNEDF